MMSKYSDQMPLEGLKVIDIGVLLAGPLIGTILADFGAEVIKVEHPRGDPLRFVGPNRDGVSLLWKLYGRNKKNITIDLHFIEGQALLKRLIEDADVLIENFRPGRLEAWNLGYKELSKINPRLIMTRVSGYGQFGPYKDKPGFGTIAEGISGFAYANGFPNNPPTLPPVGLADTIAAQYGTFATLMALYHRDHGGGKGQIVDVSLYEPIFSTVSMGMNCQVLQYDQLGLIPIREGNRTKFEAPRNIYKTRDGGWISISATTQATAERVFKTIGQPNLQKDPYLRDHHARVKKMDEIDSFVGEWIANHDLIDALEQFERNGAVAGPVYNIAQIFEDPHFKARQNIISVSDRELGVIKMHNVAPRLISTPGRIKHPGQSIGYYNREIFIKRLGLTEAEFKRLQKEQVI